MAIHLQSRGLALLAAGLVLVLAACGGEQQAAGVETSAEKPEVANVAKIEGNVMYRERIMLPPHAEVEVQLEDVSRADAMATVMASVMFKADGGPPYPFVIEYDPGRIEERMRYALRARITVDGQLRFTNTEYIDPFSGNPVQVMVQGVGRPHQPAKAEVEVATAADKADAGSEGGDIVWVLDTLGGEVASLGSGGAPVDLQLNFGDSRASGFSGCNRYTGGISNDGSSHHGTPLKFGPMAGTRRACADGDELERSYLQALGRVSAYRMESGNLLLLAGEEVVATFKPR